MDNHNIQKMTATHAAILAPQIAAIDPWNRLRITETGIAKMLTSMQPDHEKRSIIVDDQPVGAIVIHLDWLLGPYLKHLSVLPSAQGSGMGSAAIEWLVAFAIQRKQANVWLCVSGFNLAAQRFYLRHNFNPVGTIADLVISGETEILMHRRIEL